MIIIKTHMFPVASETFVVSNIVQALKMGYQVKIIADVINSIHFSSQTELINKLNIMDLVEVNPIPKNKISRFFRAIKYAFNPKRCFFFIKYTLLKKRISLSYLFVLKFFENYKNASLFHIHFANAAEEISILKYIGFFNPKLMVTFHGVDAHCASEADREQKVKAYSKFYDLWDKITVNTPFLKQNLINLNIPEHQISIIPMGIDLDFYSPLISSKSLDTNDTLKLVSVGRLIELKGHTYGIQAVKLLKDKGVKVHYTIIGYGKLYDTLKTQIEKLNLEDDITLFGQASQEQVKEVLEASHVFLMTSIKDAEGREETQGVVTAEAQAMGLPVVGFKSGGVPYTTSKDTSVLVKQKDVEALVNAVIEMTKSPSDFKDKSNAARHLATSNFGLPTMITSFYKDMM